MSSQLPPPPPQRQTSQTSTSNHTDTGSQISDTSDDDDVSAPQDNVSPNHRLSLKRQRQHRAHNKAKHNESESRRRNRMREMFAQLRESAKCQAQDRLGILNAAADKINELQQRLTVFEAWQAGITVNRQHSAMSSPIMSLHHPHPRPPPPPHVVSPAAVMHTPGTDPIAQPHVPYMQLNTIMYPYHHQNSALVQPMGMTYPLQNPAWMGHHHPPQQQQQYTPSAVMPSLQQQPREMKRSGSE